MAKKKKTKMMTLSDRDYDNYIMQLKDERPTAVIVPKEDEKESGNQD